MRSGEEGDRFFVLLEGRADVLMDAVAVAQLHPGDQFGEIALLYESRPGRCGGCRTRRHPEPPSRRLRAGGAFTHAPRLSGVNRRAALSSDIA